MYFANHAVRSVRKCYYPFAANLLLSQSLPRGNIILNVSYAIALIISAAISAVIAVIAWKRRAAPGASGLMFFNVADVVWAGTYAVRWMVVDPSAQFFWLDVT